MPPDGFLLFPYFTNYPSAHRDHFNHRVMGLEGVDEPVAEVRSIQKPKKSKKRAVCDPDGFLAPGSTTEFHRHDKKAWAF